MTVPKKMAFLATLFYLLNLIKYRFFLTPKYIIGKGVSLRDGLISITNIRFINVIMIALRSLLFGKEKKYHFCKLNA